VPTPISAVTSSSTATTAPATAGGNGTSGRLIFSHFHSGDLGTGGTGAAVTGADFTGAGGTAADVLSADVTGGDFMGNDFIGGPFGGMVSRVRHRVASVISQSHLALPVAPAGAAGMETTGGCTAGRAEPAGLLPSALAAGLPRTLSPKRLLG